MIYKKWGRSLGTDYSSGPVDGGTGRREHWVPWEPQVYGVLCKFPPGRPKAVRRALGAPMQMNWGNVHRFPRSTAIPGQVSNAQSGCHRRGQWQWCSPSVDAFVQGLFWAQSRAAEGFLWMPVLVSLSFLQRPLDLAVAVNCWNSSHSIRMRRRSQCFSPCTSTPC